MVVERQVAGITAGVGLYGEHCHCLRMENWLALRCVSAVQRAACYFRKCAGELQDERYLAKTVGVGVGVEGNAGEKLRECRCA